MKLTDAEKTRRLAEGCMGWKAEARIRYGRDKNDQRTQTEYIMYVAQDGRNRYSDDWQPLTNEAHAAEVRERMLDLGYEVTMVYGQSNVWLSMRKHPLDKTRYGKRGEMCRISSECALLALGLAKEEEL